LHLTRMYAVAQLVEALFYKPEGRRFDEAIGFSIDLVPAPALYMALGSAQPLTEMSTRNFPGGRQRPARKFDNLTAMCEQIV
jgi:hypothetical protein